MADEFESKWGEVKSSSTFQKLSPREQQDLARFYARKMGREKHGIKGSDPRMKAFLAENLGQTPTRPSTKSAFGEGLREGFDQSAVGMTANRKLPEPGMGIIDAVKEISADRLFGEGALRGIAGATGAMVGQTPDLLLGAGAGSLAAKGLAKAGVKALPAAVAASVGTGAAIPGAAVKIAGGSNDQATQAAALGAAGGLLPFAGKIPAGKLNPNLTRPAPPPKPVIPARPGPGRVPMVNMAKNQEPKVYQARDPVPPTIDELLAARKPITDPARMLPPGETFMTVQPNPGTIAKPTGIAPTNPGAVRGVPGTHEAAFAGQVGERPGTTAQPRGMLLPPDPAATSIVPKGIAPLPPGGAMGRAQTPYGRMMAPFPDEPARLGDESSGIWRFLSGEEGSASPEGALGLPAIAAGKAIRGGADAVRDGLDARMVNPLGAALSVDNYGPRETLDLLRSVPNQTPAIRRAIRAMEEDLSEPASQRLWGQRGPAQNPTDAPAPVQGGGAFLVTGDDSAPRQAWQMPIKEFLGDSKITKAANAADLIPQLDRSVQAAPSTPFMGGRFQIRRGTSERRLAGTYAVLDGDKVIATYDGTNLVVDRKYRRQGIATELVAAFREGNPSIPVASARTPNAQKTQKAAHRSIVAKAISDGKPVPPEVLADYPELAAKAPAPNQAGGSLLGRLASDEDGTFDPAAAYQAAGQAVEGARQLWRGGKDIAARATRAAAPIVQRLSPVERAVMGSGAQALGERTGINAATRGAAAAFDRELHSPTTVGPEGFRAVADAAKRYGTSGYNVPDDVFQQYTRIAPARAREQFKPTGELAVDLAKRLTSGEQFDLHKQAAEPTYQGALSPDAQRVRADNQRVSDYLLSLGVITPEEHAKWGDTYLPREYAMHEATDKGAAAAFRVKRGVNKIKGSYGRGTEEVVNGQKQWRDYTPEERAKWGERRNVSRGLALKKARGEQQAAAAEFLRWVGQQPDYTIDPKVTSPGVPYAKLPETIQGPDGQTFRLLSDKDATPGGARRRVKRYGDLSGKYVREDVHGFIWDQVLLDDLVRAGNVLSQNPLWKRMKTIWNAPNYFINNAFHNTPMLLANGGALSDVPAAAVKVLDHDPLVARLEADGFIKNDAMAHELAGHVVRILREQNQSTMPGAFTMSKILSDAADNLRALEGEGYNIAQSTDDFFRVALVDRLMQDGVPYEEAAKRMQGTYYNPDQVTAPAARLLGATAVPFAKVNWYVADALKNTVANNPLRTAQIVALYYAAPYVMGALQGKGPAAIDQEREALPPHMQGTGNALPIQVPGAGVPTWVSFAAGNPLNNWMANDEAPLPIIKGFTPGGFLPSLLPLTQRNGIDPFTGKPIVERDQEKNIVKDNRMDYLMRNFAPGAISTAWRTSEAMQGHVTPRGDIIPRPVAAARALGIQAQPVDLEGAADMAGIVGKNDARKYRTEAYRLLRYAEAARENGEEGAAERAEAEADRFLEQAAQAEQAAGRKAERLTPKEVAP